MGGWLLAIVGIVSVGVLLDIIIPEGETNKYIKGIFSIIVVLVIVSPLPKLLNKDFNFEDLFSTEKAYIVDDNFTSSVVKERNEKRQDGLKKVIEDNNIKVKRVKIGIKSNDYNQIEYVKIYIDKSSIKNEQENINITDRCKTFTIQYLSVEIGEVMVYAE